MRSSKAKQVERCLKQIRKSEVPEYLRESELFLSLSDEGDDDIEVPSDCMKLDLTIHNAADLESLLMTMRFWILTTLPVSLMDFITNHYSDRVDEVLGRFDVEFNLQSMAKEFLYNDGEARLHVAARYGQVDFVSYFVEEGLARSILVLNVAVEWGHLDCLRLLHSAFETQGTKYLFKQRDYDYALFFGRLNCLVYMVDHGEEIGEGNCLLAARSNQEHCLRYLLQHSPFRSANIPNTASSYGHWDCVRCAVECGCELQNWLLTKALFAGLERYARLLHAYHCPMPINAVECATIGGSGECLAFLAELGYDCYVPSTMATAARVGRLDLVTHLLEQGCDWDESAPTAALQAGKADCLALFLQLRGIPKAARFQIMAEETDYPECEEILKKFVDIGDV